MPIVEIPKISPYDALFHVALNYTSLRIFGCACYPWLRPYWSHKLELKSIKCVFVGYSLQHKGYRCLDPSTSRVYISKHVIFEELMFTLAKPDLSPPPYTFQTHWRSLGPLPYFTSSSPIGQSHP